MLGRHVRIKAGVFASAIYWGQARKEEIAHREARRKSSSSSSSRTCQEPIAGLAYGLRKRVELGRALAWSQRVLLDEPMGGMNHDEKEDMAR